MRLAQVSGGEAITGPDAGPAVDDHTGFNYHNGFNHDVRLNDYRESHDHAGAGNDHNNTAATYRHLRQLHRDRTVRDLYFRRRGKRHHLDQMGHVDLRRRDRKRNAEHPRVRSKLRSGIGDS